MFCIFSFSPFLSFFSFSSFFFIFLHFSSFFFSFFLFWIARNSFFSPLASRFLVTFLSKRNIFLSRRRVPLWPSFPSWIFLFFFIFSQESFFFLFSCISFTYFVLLALVSEFNCFLRSRCSMEMWCPDDIGRDSWDWVGPLAWERA